MTKGTNMAADIGMDVLAKAYINLRAAIQKVTNDYEQSVQALEAQKDLITNAMKDKMLALGVNSMKTQEGTIILGTQTRFNATDWDAFKAFVKENDALDLFEKRIHQGNMKEFLDAHPDKLPQGLNADTKYTVSVRKPSSK